MVIGLAASACGGSTGSVDVTEVVPRLPGEGAASTGEPAAPQAATGPATPEPDPWAGRGDLITPPAPGPPGPVTLPPIQRFTLPNGLRVMVVTKRDVPVVDVQLMIRAGTADVPLERMGLARFASAMLPKGTRTRDARAIARTIDAAGGVLTADAGFEATLLSCKALAEHQSTCLTLVADIAARPSFPDQEMARVRAELHAAVRQRLDDAGALASAHFRNLLWGDDHVRGRPMSARTIDSIEREDLVSWHRTWFVPGNALLVVSGDVNGKGLRMRLGRAFRAWRRGKAPEHATYPDPELPATRIRLVDKPGQTQAHIRIGHLGITHRDPSFFDTVIFNHVLGGGGLSSRLMRVVRAEAGKTYGASSHFDRNIRRGDFVVSTFTRNAETLATVQLLLRELERMRQEGPAEAEVRAAAAHLGGQYAINFQSAADVAGALLAAELHGFDEDYVRSYPVSLAAVTPESAARAAAAHLHPQAAVMVLVGDARALEPQLEQADWPYEKVGHLQPIARAERAASAGNTGNAAGSASPEAVAAGKKLLARALAAKGGEDRLRGIRTMTVNAAGTIRSGGQEISAGLTRRYAAPDKLRLDLDLRIPGGGAQVITVLDGARAWSKQPTGVVELPPEGIAELRKQLWRDQELVLLRAKDQGTRVESLGRQTRDGASYDVLRITRGDGLAVTLYLDPARHLPRLLIYDEMGVETVERFDDYRAVSGVQVPYRRHTKNAQAELDVRVESVTVNQPIAPELFARPE